MRPTSLRLLFVLTPLLMLGEAKVSAQQSAARIWNEQLLSAIRRNVPNPPGHARNLHHTAVAMYDAWAAYDPTAVGYLYNEKVSPLPGDIEAARAEAISYAAYRILKNRFPIPAFNGSNQSAIDNATITNNSLNAQLTTLGYSTSTAQAAITNGTTPAEVGKRIGQAVLTWGAQDGFSNTAYPQAYNATVNPNLNVPLSVLGTNASFTANMPLGYGIPGGTDPNLWQPLDLSTSVTQNGIPIPGGAQTFVGVQSLATLPFSLTRNDPLKPWLDPYGGPSRLSRPGQPSATDTAFKDNFMDVLRKSAKLNDSSTLDISPGAIGNNPLGADTGTGRATNPITGLPYAANTVQRGDYVRVLAEFWADGPNSETPPGHWHVLANQVSDNPLTVKKIKGVGPTVNDLEWDVKTYLALSGGVHDAACAAWSLKRYYSGTRPITAIRYMCSKGQSSDPFGPSYDPEGIPLEAGVTEVITAASVAPGGHHETIWDVNTGMSLPGNSVDFFGNPLFIGKIAVKSWPGEDPNNLPAPSIATHQSTVKWILGKDWLPFQRKTFNTPAFPGYISGHSTFSRSAAEVLKLLTGSPYFPGGFHHHTISANSMQIDLGPSADVDLQWTSYYDAADQAGQSRRWGGIHPYEDDFQGRVIGSQAGISAFNKAEKYWTGSIQSESIQATVTIQANGDALVTWPESIGKIYKVQKSTNMTTWSDASHNLFASTAIGSFTDVAPAAGTFYKIIEITPSIARTWNEQLLNAIRIDTPHPPKHARNLFHLATAMYDAWSAYDTTAIGYIHHERATAGDVTAARKEAVSYAAYRLLKNRFTIPAFNGSNQQAIDNATTTNNRFNAQMTAFGYDTAITTTSGTSPAALGNRIAADIIAWGLADGSNQSGGYSDPNYSNPQPAMIVLQSGVVQGGGVPFGTNPNLWQPLAFDAAFTQNGLQAELIQKYVGVTWLNTLPFALTRASPNIPWIDPGPPSALYTGGGSPSLEQAASDLEYKQGALYVLEASARMNDQTLIDMSPNSLGNSTLGTDDGQGYTVNPYTNQPYADNFVKFGDYARVMAEFWADGPQSETPPGHWHVLFNEVADNPLTQKRIGGTGPIVDDLEWDVKGYFALGGATHDAACAVWGVKRYYQGVRPITAIRYMGALGQSSDQNLPAYNRQGLPLEPGVCELVTPSTSAAGQRHEQIWSASDNAYVPGTSLINTVVVYSWPGEPADPTTQTSSVRWMRAIDWVPYQRKTFNTPAFPGYISGHSGFSRAAAEIMTAITANPFFPGGIGTFTAEANHYLVFEQGPTATTQLQWATYYDAADLAGQSRRWGGIHVREDDYKSRVIGAQSGKQVWQLAQKYWSGNVLAENVVPTQTFLPGGGVTITCPAQRGLYYHLESSNDLINWTPVTPDARCVDSTITFTDPTSTTGARFYRIVYDAKAS